jgi:integrase
MANRGRGEGNVYERSPGRWVGKVMTGGRRVTVSGLSRASVVAQIAAAAKRGTDGLPPLTDMTVEQWLEHFAELRAQSGKCSEQTIYMKRSRARKNINPAIGSIRLKNLTVTDLDNLYRDLLAAGMAPGTVHQVHMVIGSALTYAHQQGLIARDVGKLASNPNPKPKIGRAITVDQARAFIAATQGERLEALFVLAITTGMRRGELLGLRWRDVHLEDAHLRVVGTLVYTPSGGIRIDEPKTEASHRRIELSDVAVDALRRRHAAWLTEGHSDRWPDLVFGTETGTPTGYSSLLRQFTRVLKNADIPTIKFHELRHSAGSLAYEADVPMQIIQTMLGHSSIQTTMDIYGHPNAEMGKRASAAVDKLFG